nr:hypothetical protein [Pandoravirus aubagnensis]
MRVRRQERKPKRNRKNPPIKRKEKIDDVQWISAGLPFFCLCAYSARTIGSPFCASVFFFLCALILRLFCPCRSVSMSIAGLGVWGLALYFFVLFPPLLVAAVGFLVEFVQWRDPSCAIKAVRPATSGNNGDGSKREVPSCPTPAVHLPKKGASTKVFKKHKPIGNDNRLAVPPVGHTSPLPSATGPKTEHRSTPRDPKCTARDPAPHSTRNIGAAATKIFFFL